MVTKDLKAFGDRLHDLRITAGLYQDQLVERLSQIHARVDPDKDLKLDSNRISKWERAFTDNRGREWRPRRQYLLYMVEAFRDLLTPKPA